MAHSIPATLNIDWRSAVEWLTAHIDENGGIIRDDRPARDNIEDNASDVNANWLRQAQPCTPLDQTSNRRSAPRINAHRTARRVAPYARRLSFAEQGENTHPLLTRQHSLPPCSQDHAIDLCEALCVVQDKRFF
jgi:hypothetical protein